MKILLITIGFLLTGCATTHPGNIGNFISGDKNMSVNISSELTDGGLKTAYQLYEITIENNSDDWLRIVNTKLLTTPESKVSVVVGSDLLSWAEAKSFQQKMDNYNKDLAIATTEMGGLALAATGKQTSSKSLEGVGAIVALAGVTWAVTDVITQTRSNAIGVKKVPNSHIYESFSVPGKMFTRKWILVNKPTGVIINNLVFEFETISGEKSIYEIHM